MDDSEMRELQVLVIPSGGAGGQARDLANSQPLAIRRFRAADSVSIVVESAPVAESTLGMNR